MSTDVIADATHAPHHHTGPATHASLDSPSTLHSAQGTTPYPPNVSNIEDAQRYAQRRAEALARVAELTKERDDAIWRARTEDGLSLRAIGAAVGLSEGSIRLIERVQTALHSPTE